MNPFKIIPKTIGQCKCMCCSDCAYYDEKISWEGCVQRNKLSNKYNYKQGKLGV